MRTTSLLGSRSRRAARVCVFGSTLALTLLWAAGTRADTAPGFRHEPVTGVAAGAAVQLVVELDAPAKVRRARVRFRAAGARVYDKVDMRVEDGRLVASVPAEKVSAPAFEYYIAAQLKDGTVKAVFADARTPQRVEVRADSGETSPTGESPARGTPRNGDVGLSVTGGEDEFAAQPGSGVAGRRIPGAGMSAEGALFLAELAAFAAEDESAVRRVVATVVEARFVSALERDEIRRLGARTLLDVLAVMPGVSTSRDVLGFDRVALRGVRGDARLALILDGQRLNNPFDGRALYKLPADLIERVEVVRGPVFGGVAGQAMAGAILVTTRQEPGLSAHVFGGSFLTGGASASGAARLGDVDVRGGAQLSYMEGPRLSIARDSSSSSDIERSPELMRTHADELSGALNLGASLKLSGGGQVFGQTLLMGEGRGPYVGVFDTVGEGSRLSWLAWGVLGGFELPIGDLGGVVARAWVDQHWVDRLLQVSPAAFVAPSATGALERFDDGVLVHLGYSALQTGADAELSLSLFDGNTFRLGLGAGLAAVPPGGYRLDMNRALDGTAKDLGPVPGLPLEESGPCAFYGGELGALGACRVTLSAWASDEWSLLPELALTGGLGLLSFSDTEWSALTHLTPQLGVVFTPLTGLTLRAAATGGVRPPTWEERYDQVALAYVGTSTGGYVGNPELGPEHQLSLELSGAYRFALAGVAYSLEGAAFASRLSDAIDAIDLTGNVEQPGNRGGYEMLGAEAAARAAVPGGSGAFFNLSWTRGYFRAPIDLDPGEPVCSLYPWDAPSEPCTLLTHLPQLRANVGVHLALGALGDLTAWTELYSARQNNARSTLERLRPFRIPGFALVNLSYKSPRLFDTVGLEARVFNLLDAQHRDDVPRPDRMTGLLPREGVAAYAGLTFAL